MCVFGGGSTPPPPPPPAPPPPVIDTTQDNPASNAARNKEAERARLSKGLASTILTSPLGDTSQATTQKSTVLGSTSSY